jgi:UDP-N-acetylglucosamine--N-acetylmuramyl-(pentapeptide) pyrophosphoryl-undecaprenol N-acetylglucosamine transferase
MSRILLACGGTGGHIAPGIALAQRLKEEGHEPLLVVSRKIVDTQMTAKYAGLNFVAGRGRGFGPGVINKLLFFPALLGSIVSAWLEVRKFRPQVLICFGGFMSLAPAMVCALQGIPVLVHEANRRPGKAVRMIARFAQSVHLPTGVRIDGLAAERQHDAGFPIRQEIFLSAREVARKAINFPLTGRLLLITGGSQGAQVLTHWVEANLAQFTSRDVHVLCLTGAGGRVGEVRTENSIVRFETFCNQMGSAYSASDLAITRAGAGTIAELASCRTPSILIPYPLAADDHQTANAQSVAGLGAAELLSESSIAQLSEKAFMILNDKTRLAAMRDALAMLDANNRWDEMYVETLQLAAAYAAKNK